MIGDWHTLNGYTFRETMHGPMVWGVCVDCGKPAAEMQPTGQPTDVVTPNSRCDTCGRKHHGASLDYYRTGRAELYRSVGLFDPTRRDPQYGGRVAAADFFAEIADRNLPPEQRPLRCRVCVAPMDPAARTEEHPDVHPTCVRYPADAPMETPLT